MGFGFRRHSVLILMASALWLPSCRTEKEIRLELEPARQAGISAYRLLSVLHIAEEIALRRQDGFLTASTRITQTDSLLSDGDGLEFVLSFGSGVTLTDGIMRKGRCRLEISDTAFPQLYWKWSASPADSFAISSKTGWEFCVGWTGVQTGPDLTGKLLFDLEFQGATQSTQFRMISTDTLNLIYSQPLQFSKTTEILNGDWLLKTGDARIAVTAISLSCTGACRSNWNTGKLVVKHNEMSFDTHMDPYGNEACDQVFKVSRKARIQKDEMVFDAW